MVELMDAPSLALIALVAVVLACLVGGVAWVRWKGGVASIPWTAVVSTAAIAIAWLAFTGLLAGGGLLRNYDALPPPMLRVFGPGLVLAALAAFSPFGARLADGLGWGALIGFQVFRVPVELMLSALYASGKIPVQMTFHGFNYDIATGISAPIVAWLAMRGYAGSKTILVWNVAGLALLANIVTIAVLSMPGRFQVFSNGPANTIVFGWPFIWLPTWLVLAAWFGHLLVFRKVLRDARSSNLVSATV